MSQFSICESIPNSRAEAWCEFDEIWNSNYIAGLQ